MIRRGWFMGLLGLACGLLVLCSGLAAPAQQATPAQQAAPAQIAPIRGVWMTSNDADTLRDRAKLQAALTQLHQLNFNTLYPVVWNAGYAFYPSAVAQRQKIQSFTYTGLDGQDILADITQRAHALGMLVVPWFEFGFMAPPSSELALQHPDWLTQRRDGSQTSVSDAGEVVWLNPFLPEVQKFISDLVLEIISQYPVDGIQFDDHMSLPNEFGYDRATLALYTKETKKAAPSNPQDAAWVKWRADKITAFMTQLRNAVKAAKPNALFSVSPNYYDFAYKLHLQDWLTWVRRGIVDELIVQVYRSDLSSFIEQISRSELQETQQKIPTGIGILAGLRSKPVAIGQIETQGQATQERGLGISFFYYETLWNGGSELVSDRVAGLQRLFPTATPRQPIISQVSQP
jgi:uncharacterized lipoprotein YddW (UPF0748 family)